MMIDPQLLEILVCPENHLPVGMADAALLEKLNRAITEGNVKNRSGQPVTEPLTAGLVRQDGAVVYPIIDEIPVMLTDEAIELAQLS